MISMASVIGIAYPIPSTLVSEYFAELIPISSPCAFKSAPPLLPGLIAASVWISPSQVVVAPVDSSCTVMVRSSALTIPVVTDCPYPSALPIAIVPSPTLSVSESPIVIWRMAANVSASISFKATFTTARSFAAYVPWISPETVVSFANWTLNVSAPDTT